MLTSQNAGQNVRLLKLFWSTVGIIAGCHFSARADVKVTFANLFSFSGTNGIEPEGKLLQMPDGCLYGTATDTTLEKWGNANFGFKGHGAIYKITTNGVFSTIAMLERNKTNAAYPRAGLTFCNDGNFYGTTTGGGTNHRGTIFKVTTNGVVTIIYSFSKTNGCSPCAGLLQNGNCSFVSTTFEGGLEDARFANVPNVTHGWGTVFGITTKGSLKTFVFFDKTNGAGPNSDLIQGDDGNLYGTTSSGGRSTNNMLYAYDSGGFGTLFKISPERKLTTLHDFSGVDGTGPLDAQQTPGGDLYGITINDGATNTANPDEAYSWRPFVGSGTIFEITKQGYFKTLVLFYGKNGANPDSFILGRDGNFYGATIGGGAHNLGTIFKLTPNGKFTTLYSFTEGGGTWPNKISIMQGMDGNLYGTTTRCGKNQSGSIFCLTIGR